MASGIGAFGGTSQCYRFWLGFSECRVSRRKKNLFFLGEVWYKPCTSVLLQYQRLRADMEYCYPVKVIHSSTKVFECTV